MEFTFLMETIKAIGYPALIFVIWYLTNKQANLNMGTLIKEYKHANEEMVKEMREIASTLRLLRSDQPHSQ